MPAKVVHCKREPYDLLIDRTTLFGNPFRIGVDGTRKEVVLKHRHWITGVFGPDVIRGYDRRKVREEIVKRPNEVFGCWCAPRACHGDSLLEIANTPPTTT